VNSALLGAYGVGVFAWGWVVDRYGTKIGYAWSIATWSVAAAAPALVASVGGFLGARMFLGVSEGGNFQAAIKAVALWFPRSERAFATAIFNSGTNVGAIVAPAIVPVIALAFGWRSVFVLAGVAGFLWLFLWLHSTTSRRSSRGSRGRSSTTFAGTRTWGPSSASVAWLARPAAVGLGASVERRRTCTTG